MSIVSLGTDMATSKVCISPCTNLAVKFVTQSDLLTELTLCFLPNLSQPKETR